MINLAQYQKTFDRAMNTGHPDTALTLKSFQRRAGVTRGAVMMLTDEYKADLKKLQATYSPKEFEARRAALDEEYNGIVKIAKQRLTDDLNEVLEAKRKQFDKSTGAPTEAQLRLLQVLSMRTEMTQSEITLTAEKMNNNIPALRLLRDIAKRHGIDFPDVGNADKLNEAIDNAEQFSLEMIESIANPELTYQQTCFYDYPDSQTVADYYFGPLDQSILVAAQAKPPKVEPGEHNAVKVYLRGDESLAGIADQFHINSEDIRKANPDRDSFDFKEGDTLIVPSGMLRVTNLPGSIVEGQCIPIHYEA